MSRSKIVGAIEIGTSKVVVLVAEMNDGRSMNIIGRGQSTNSGMKKGDNRKHRDSQSQVGQELVLDFGKV